MDDGRWHPKCCSIDPKFGHGEDVLLYTTNSEPKPWTIWLSKASVDPVEAVDRSMINPFFLHAFGGRRESVLCCLCYQTDSMGLSAIDQIPDSDTQCAFYDHKSLRSPSCKRFGALYSPISIEVASESCEKSSKRERLLCLCTTGHTTVLLAQDKPWPKNFLRT